MKSYMYLYFYANKNYFFDRFKFLRNKILEKFYYIMVVLKQLLLILALIIIGNKISYLKTILSIIPFVIFYYKIFSIDTKKWAHYYRKDWGLAYPSDTKRFFVIMISNFIIDFIIEDNIFIYFMYSVNFFEFSFVLLVYTTIVFLYFTTMIFELILMQVSLFLKKIYSFINYIVSNITSMIIFYIIFNFIIEVIINIVNKKNILSFIIKKVNLDITNLIFNLNKFYINKIFILTILILIFNLIMVFSLLKRDKLSFDLNKLTPKMKDLYILKFYYLLYKTFTKRESYLVKKEFLLISELFSFNYMEYYNTFLVDRSIFILSSILFIIVKYKASNIFIILFPLIFIFIFMDISSGISTKLVANMSFSSDFNMLRAFNSINRDIKELIVNKLRLFNLFRFMSYFSYIIIIFLISFYINIPIKSYILLLMVVIINIILLPRIFFINNLIYTRIEYRNFNKYIEDISFISNNIKDFFLLDIYYKIMYIWLFSTIVAYNLNIYFYNIIYIGILIFSVILVFIYLIMKKIEKNIIDSIKEGDFSVNISKIFKK